MADFEVYLHGEAVEAYGELPIAIRKKARNMMRELGNTSMVSPPSIGRRRRRLTAICYSIGGRCAMRGLGRKRAGFLVAIPYNRRATRDG